MKKIFVLGLLLCSMMTFGQNHEFKRDIPITTDKNNTYNAILIWVAESFNDSNEVVKLKDKDSGIIVIKGVIKDNTFTTSFTIRFTITETNCNVIIKDWKETNYGYLYNDESNCYTNSCKKNVKKWSLTVDSNNNKLTNELIELLN